MIRRQHVVRDFFDEAKALRDAFDARVSNPYADTIRWRYFCDPARYTYLHTPADEVFPADIFERFMTHMREWCLDSLGLMPDAPRLHLMINGCRLGLHSDFHNGTWGFVYSLTHWDARRFAGGETLLLRDGIPSYKRHHVHGDALYELVPAHFNQLLVFDDRIVHATPVIEGSMSPLEGRLALVGHIRPTSPVVTGALGAAEVGRTWMQTLTALRPRLTEFRDVQGTITYRLSVGADGAVTATTVLMDNLVTPVTGYAETDVVTRARSVLNSAIGALRFPASAGESTVTLPVLVPIPDLRPIKCELIHSLADNGRLQRWMQKLEKHRTYFRGMWNDGRFDVMEPIAGTIRVEPHQIEASFDAPMWVPSQRENFQKAVTDVLRQSLAE